jgi:hypothetical protein
MAEGIHLLIMAALSEYSTAGPDSNGRAFRGGAREIYKAAAVFW